MLDPFRVVIYDEPLDLWVWKSPLRLHCDLNSSESISGVEQRGRKFGVSLSKKFNCIWKYIYHVFPS